MPDLARGRAKLPARGGRRPRPASVSASPTAQELLKQALRESWGFTVNLIDDDATQAEFDTAIVANDVAAPATGFRHDTNAVTILSPGGGRDSLSLASKFEIARAVLRTVVAARAPSA